MQVRHVAGIASVAALLQLAWHVLAAAVGVGGSSPSGQKDDRPCAEPDRLRAGPGRRRAGPPDGPGQVHRSAAAAGDARRRGDDRPARRLRDAGEEQPRAGRGSISSRRRWSGAARNSRPVREPLDGRALTSARCARPNRSKPMQGERRVSDRSGAAEDPARGLQRTAARRSDGRLLVQPLQRVRRQGRRRACI